MRSLRYLQKIQILLFLIIGVFASANSYADVYKYKDKEGNVHYVDDPSKIPEEFKDTAILPHSLPNIIHNSNSREHTIEPQKKSEADLAAERELNKLIAQVTIAPPDETPVAKKEADITPEQKKVIEKLGKFLTPPIITFFVFVLLIYGTSMWVLFKQANMPGYGILVPIYNGILLSRLGGYSGWWFLLILVPVIGPAAWGLTINFGIAKNFGKSDLFAVGMALLPFVFAPMIAFGQETTPTKRIPRRR